MYITLILLAGIMATLLGWLLKQTFNTEPWIAETLAEDANQGPLDARPKVIGLTTLLAVISSFFALIASAYAMRMNLGDWLPLHEPRLLWVNTGLLALASVAIQWTRSLALRDRPSGVRAGLLVTGALSAAFVVGQFVAWRELEATGHYINSNPATAFFYLLTGAHALHVLGGLYVWLRATTRTFAGVDALMVRQSIELCAIYWHFLLLVWLALFALLLST